MAIKVVLVGLSAHAVSGWAANAHLPYLLSERGRGRFEIVALLNSSEQAAHAAIAHFGLPPAPATAAYGDAARLGADLASGALQANLVVVATRVDVHYPAVLPVLEAVVRARQGQTQPADFGVLVEWPLASNLDEVRRLADLAAKGNGLRSAVSLQGRVAPFYLAVRDVVASGRLGRLLGSEARAYGGSFSGTTQPESLAFFFDRATGGHLGTVGLGHLIDSIQFALGELQSPQVLAQLQRPDITLRRKNAGDDGWTVVRTIRSDVPDLFVVAGTLAPLRLPAAAAAKNAAAPAFFSDGAATLLVRLRSGEPFPGEPAYVWTVTGEKGELRLVSRIGPFAQAAGGGGPGNDGPTAVTLSLHDFASGQVAEVPWQWQDWQQALAPVPARNIGALYEAYAEGRDDDYATFADALARHEQLEGILAAFKG